MHVAVIGGRGEAGRAIVAALERRGVRALVVGRADAGGDRDRRQADVATGDGLVEALDGADAVVHAANSARRAREVLVEGTANLLRAAPDAGVGHLVSLSIVGCERVPLGYYRAKTDQDRVLAAAHTQVPWSIVPASQFHALVESVFTATRRIGWLPGGPARLRPVASAVVGERVAEVALGPALGRANPVVGPKPASLGELAEAFKRATGSRALVVPAPLVGGPRRALLAGALAGDPALEGSGLSFETWLRAREAR